MAERNDNGSDGTSSASETSAERSDASQKKRKTTYYTRKDEIAALQAEIKTLQDSLRLAEQAALINAGNAHETMTESARAAFYDKSIERNNLKLAGTQAMLSSYNMTVGKSVTTIPLKSFVHLPADKEKRNDVMKAIHLEKLRATHQFMAARTRGLDLSVPHRHQEQYDFPNCEISILGFDVTHFDSGHSLRQVYDAFMEFIGNQEICMSTELGLLTIRESVDDYGDTTYTQTRFLSTLPEGLEIESNAVMFAACVDATPDKPAYGIGFVEFVDQDDLYPYRPDECGRRDMTAAVQFTTLPAVDPSRPPTVVVARWGHVRFRPPTFPLTKEVEAATRIRISHNDRIAFHVMREHLATVAPEGS